MDITTIAKYFIYFGVFFILVGGVLFVLNKLGIGNYRLPGDIVIQKENFTFYFPLATSIVISIILTIIFTIISKR